MSRGHAPRAALRRFGRDRRGAIALLFGLLLLPLLGVVGLAIDLGQILVKRNHGYMAADAAALYGAGIVRDLMESDPTMLANPTLAARKGEEAARAMMKTYATQHAIEITPRVSIVATGSTIVTSVGFTVTKGNFIGKIFGKDTFTASGEVRALASLPPFVDLHLLVDTSPSMGIAATQAGMIKLFETWTPLTDGRSGPVSCVFACHSPAGWINPRPVAITSRIAADAGIKLRIDVMRDAIATMIDKARLSKGGENLYRIAINRFGDAFAGDYTVVAPLSNQFDTIKRQIQGLDMSPGSGAAASSYIDEALAKLALAIPAGGDGTSRSATKKYMILITDGVRTVYSVGGKDCRNHRGNNGHCYSEVHEAACTAFKTKGITVAVLYTTYPPIYGDPRATSGTLDSSYAASINHTELGPKIRPALERCASPGFFFEASDDVGIAGNLSKIFEQISTAPVLQN